MSQTPSQIRRSISIGNYTFSPGLIPSLAALLVFILLIKLGFWQLSRAAYKSDVQQRVESREHLPSQTLDELLANPNDRNDLPATISGRYLNEFNFLLDNRTHKGQPGYELLTAFLTQGKILLVNRGWIAQGPTREVFPQIPSESGAQTLQGKISVPNPDFFVLKEDSYEQRHWPFLIQKIDLEKSAQLFDDPLIDFVLRLNPDDTSGFIRQWHKQILGPEKHYGYALQWFSLAIALVVIYLVVNTHRKQ